MVDFNEYRRRWVYICPACGEKVIAFRDCGASSFCRCGSQKALAEVIEPKHMESEESLGPSVQTFKPYFDVTLGKEVTSKREITEYCKRNNMVYAGDKELTQQCAQNKAENERRFNERFEAGLRQELLRRL